MCGKTTRIARAANGDAPAIGICCYRLPSAVCTDCGRRRPCFHARGPEPLCELCTRRRRPKRCLDCGELRPANRRVAGGVICANCDYKRGRAIGPCHRCTTAVRLKNGVCPACQLHDRLAELAREGDPAAVSTLTPFLRSLAAAENPASTLRWLYTPGFQVTRRLLAGEIEVSHHGLDQAAAASPRPVAFTRAKLVDTGVLEPRDETSAQFALWHARAILKIPEGIDRAHVRAYATWQVLNDTLVRHGRGFR